MYEKLHRCPICKKKDFYNYMVVKDHVVSSEYFSICKCRNCEALFTNPRPDEKNILQYYQSENYVSHQNKASNVTNFIYRIVRNITLRQKVNWLNKNTASKGRLLDYGCGTGHFLRAAGRNGWQTVGVEPHEEAAKKASTLAQSKIYNHSSQLDAEKKFDAITLFHVLEHVHELEQTLQFLLSKLKKRGTILIAVPNYDSFDSLVYKQNWAALDVPRHLYHFNQRSMQELADRYQLKIKNRIPMIFDSYYVSLLSEVYITNSKNILSALKNGFKSNKSAKKDNNFSSILYIMKKS